MVLCYRPIDRKLCKQKNVKSSSISNLPNKTSTGEKSTISWFKDN